MLIGNNKNLFFLEKAISNGLLANVYCFTGLEGLGKKTLAKKIIAQILQVEENKLLNHPDFLFIKRGFDEKTEKTKKDITVEQSEAIRNFLQIKSWDGGYRVVLLADAQLLNKTAANAILKTLEEAKEKTLIFLIATDKDGLPTTISSRSQFIDFNLVNDNELRSGLIELGFDKEKIDKAIKLSYGRPGQAIKLLNNPEELNFWEQEEKRWAGLFGKSFYQRLGDIETMFGDKKADHIKSRSKLVKILDLWIVLWRDVLLGKNLEIARKYSGRQVIKIIDEIKEAQSLLGKNIHPRLVLENVILKY